MTHLTLQAIDYLLEGQRLEEWPEAVALVRKIAAAPPAHWNIPVFTCQAAGGEPSQAIPAVAAIAALHTSIIMVDDILDGDGRFEPMGFSAGDTANLALALYAAGLDAIQRSVIPIVAQNDIVAHINQLCMITSIGQNLDAHTVVKEEEDYWKVTRKKSSPFFYACFYTGAMSGGATPEIATGLGDVGRVYGEMVQIHDDLKDILSSPASQDWAEGHYSLPVLFALTVDHPQRDIFIDLRSKVQDEQVLKEAQKILIRCGAVSYCADQLFKRYHVIRNRLDALALADRAPVDELLQKIIDPVLHLFDKIGAPRPI